MKTSFIIILNSENVGLPHAPEGVEGDGKIGDWHSYYVDIQSFPLVFCLLFCFCSLYLPFLRPKTPLTSRWQPGSLLCVFNFYILGASFLCCPIHLLSVFWKFVEVSCLLISLFLAFFVI